jgi:hypothetical protein
MHTSVELEAVTIVSNLEDELLPWPTPNPCQSPSRAASTPHRRSRFPALSLEVSFCLFLRVGRATKQRNTQKLVLESAVPAIKPLPMCRESLPEDLTECIRRVLFSSQSLPFVLGDYLDRLQPPQRIKCICINIVRINVLEAPDPIRYRPLGDEHEDHFYNRTVLAWFDLFDVRAKRVPSFYSHAAAYGRCSAVLRGAHRIPVLRGDFSVADSAGGPVACGSVRASGTDDSRGRDCQHTLLSHFHGACGFAAGCRRHDFMVSYDLECAFDLRGDPSTLSKS